VILRPGVIYGRGNLWTARLGLQAGRWWIRIGGWARLPLTYVENCAAAIVLADESDHLYRDMTFNVVDNDLPSQRAYLAELRRRTADRPKVIAVPWMLARVVAMLVEWLNRICFGGSAKVPGLLVPARLHARCKPMRYTNESICRTLGWRPIHSWRDGIRRSLGDEDLSRVPQPALSHTSHVCQMEAQPV
jgi:nucleoside-diphosphate-sugar epimerase